MDLGLYVKCVWLINSSISTFLLRILPLGDSVKYGCDNACLTVSRAFGL